MTLAILSKPELGLVCITASNEVRYRTVTRKRLLQLETPEQEKVLRELYTDNLHRFQKAIDFCRENQIKLYRLTSNLLPFADDAIGQALLPEFSTTLGKIGESIRQNEIRVVLHPDQFVVLNSDRAEVIENSIKILSLHAQIFDALGLPRSPYALMNIHGGKGNRAEKLISVIRDLPDPIRTRLTLENDEYTYSTTELLEVCQKAEIPLVFDAHHHIIHEKLKSYDHPSVAQTVAETRQTWVNPQQQLVHISNGKERFADPQHSDLITEMPNSYRQVPWIEVEAKLKEKAIAKLRQEWLNEFH